MTQPWRTPLVPPIGPGDRPHLERLGARLRRLRHDAGLTQRELGDLAGVSDRTISGIETARARTPKSTLAKLVDHLVAPDDHERVLEELVAATGPALGLDAEERAQLRLERRIARRNEWATQPERLRQAIRTVKSTLSTVRSLERSGFDGADRMVETTEAELARLEAQLAERLRRPNQEGGTDGEA